MYVGLMNFPICLPRKKVGEYIKNIVYVEVGIGYRIWFLLYCIVKGMGSVVYIWS